MKGGREGRRLRKGGREGGEGREGERKEGRNDRTVTIEPGAV